MIAMLLAIVFEIDSYATLQASVRVNGPEFASTGTIIACQDGYSYVLSTGHMGKRTDPTVEVFYANGSRLSKAVELKAQIILLVDNHEKGIDFSILKFEIPQDFKLRSIPLAERVIFDKLSVSVGCDMGQAPKAYCVLPLNWHNRKRDFWLKCNPGETIRAGRSGGGVFHGRKLIGVLWGCWHGPNASGTEYPGIVVGSDAIRKVIRTNGLGHLLKIPLQQAAVSVY